MTVQELIDVLNKIEDKSKTVYIDYMYDIEEVAEGTYYVEIY